MTEKLELWDNIFIRSDCLIYKARRFFLQRHWILQYTHDIWVYDKARQVLLHFTLLPQPSRLKSIREA